ncbi:MAG: aspartate 1-decarboxylase [Acidobacteria bacterium]|nr:MAG: aspartate 1-decarboxylase [Acidobacteriota bacterium]MCE7960509.1 aspartate 1-decarboxylase [Acidobacteria bacterium ACB2]
MELTMLKAKIHRATVTDANLDYEGSITIDTTLLEAAGILPYERVEVYNVTRGTRFATYAIEGPAGGGDIGVNGAAAHLAKRGDLVIVAAYAAMAPEEARRHVPSLVFVDGRNRIREVKASERPATVTAF